MPVFEEVRVRWKDEDRVLPANMVLRCIAEVEDILSLGQLSARVARGRLPLAKLSMGLGVLVRACGWDATDDEVYDVLFQDQGKHMTERAMAAVTILQALMIPPKHLRGNEEPNGPKGDAAAGQRSGPSRSATAS